MVLSIGLCACGAETAGTAATVATLKAQEAKQAAQTKEQLLNQIDEAGKKAEERRAASY